MHNLRDVELVSHAERPLEDADKLVHRLYPRAVDLRLGRGGEVGQVQGRSRWGRRRGRYRARMAMRRSGEHEQRLDGAVRLVHRRAEVICTRGHGRNDEAETTGRDRQTRTSPRPAFLLPRRLPVSWVDDRRAVELALGPGLAAPLARPVAGNLSRVSTQRQRSEVARQLTGINGALEGGDLLHGGPELCLDIAPERVLHRIKASAPAHPHQH